MSEPTVLIVARLRDHVALHWQTLLEAHLRAAGRPVAASGNDPILTHERARAFARAWGSGFVEVGPQGLVNPASGHGPWPRAEQLLAELD